MSTGTLVTIIEKQKFEFSYLPANQTETIILAKAVNVIPFYHGSLWVRLHTNRCGSGVQAAKVLAYAVNPSSHDQQKFLTGSAVLDTGNFQATSAPALISASAAAALPPFLEIQLLATQHLTVPTNIFFEISVDLLLRPA